MATTRYYKSTYGHVYSSRSGVLSPGTEEIDRATFLAIRREQRDSRGATYQVTLPAEYAQKVRHFAKQRGLTPGQYIGALVRQTLRNSDTGK